MRYWGDVGSRSFNVVPKFLDDGIVQGGAVQQPVMFCAICQSHVLGQAIFVNVETYCPGQAAKSTFLALESRKE